MPSSFFLLLALFLIGCGSSLKIPKPNSGASRPVPPLEASVVRIPVSIDLRSVMKQVENAVPKGQRAANDWTVVGRNAVGDIGVKYELRRDPLQLLVSWDGATITSHAYYWFQFAQRVPKPIIGGSFWQQLGSCGVGEPLREALIGIRIKAAWKDNWTLEPTTWIDPVTFANKCQVTFLKFDVTDRVNEAFVAGLRQGKGMIEAKIREAGNLRAVAEKVWKQLQEPIALDSGLWLTFDPRSAGASDPGGSAYTVTSMVGIVADARVIAGSRPAAGSRPLPKLTSAPPGKGFHVTLQAEISFADASRRLAKALMGTSYTKLGHTATVADASIYGAGDQAVIQLALKGDIEGTVYLVGVPLYDPEKNLLYVRDLDYSLETGQTLANAADWLFHGAFRSSIAEKLRLELADPISDIRKRLEKALNRPIAPNVKLRGSVSDISPVGVFIVGDRFQARASIDGTLALDVEGKF